MGFLRHNSRRWNISLKKKGSIKNPSTDTFQHPVSLRYSFQSCSPAELWSPLRNRQYKDVNFNLFINFEFSTFLLGFSENLSTYFMRAQKSKP